MDGGVAEPKAGAVEYYDGFLREGADQAKKMWDRFNELLQGAGSVGFRREVRSLD